MAVSMQSTESGGVVNFSVGDTLTVNGKIVAQGLVTPDAGVRYTDYKNRESWSETRYGSSQSYNYTVPADGILTLSVSCNDSQDIKPSLTVTINGESVPTSTSTRASGYAITSVPAKAGDTFAFKMSGYSSSYMNISGVFYPYR